jgi:hypothetical protein
MVGCLCCVGAVEEALQLQQPLESTGHYQDVIAANAWLPLFRSPVWSHWLFRFLPGLKLDTLWTNMICLTLCGCVAPFAVRKWGRSRALESGQEHAELLRREFGNALRELFVTQNLGPAHSFLSDRSTEQRIPYPTNAHLFLSPGFTQISCSGQIRAGPKIACDG